MNRNMILEAMYEIIKESTEWYVDSEDKKYCYFVDGVIAMTEAMLEKEEMVEKYKKIEEATGYITAIEENMEEIKELNADALSLI